MMLFMKKLSIKDDPYIKSFYQMLDTDFEEKFGISLDKVAD